METQLFAKLVDGRLLPVKSVDEGVVSLRVKRGCVLSVPVNMVRKFECFKGRYHKGL